MALQVDKFVQAMEEDDLLDTAQTQHLLSTFRQDPTGLLSYLIDKEILPQSTLANRWAEFLNVPWVNLNKTLFQPEIVEKLSKDYCLKNACIPIYRMANVITVAMFEPFNLEIITDIERMTGLRVSPVFSMITEIQDAIAIQFNSLDSISNLVDQIDLSEFSADSENDIVQLRKITSNESIVTLARTILLWGIKERASDIHIEPGENKVSIRFRIDGVMQRKMDLQLSLLNPLVSRLKVLARADIMERRHPQDGRINLQLNNDSFDFRFSSVPSIYGEKAVLRVLGHVNKHEIPSLEDLNLSMRHYRLLTRVTRSPNGIFFVTGPTGSGKSTTLFSMLKKLDRQTLNIMTVENPVEYRLPGITQIETNKDIGLGFSNVLRALLRQDPDVILLGEIRDMESARMAAEAALTGHLVMSTLHTNDAIQAVTRLIEIGVEPFLVAPAIIGVMAQRLLRRLCPDCCEKYELDRKTASNIFTAYDGRPVHMYRARGCPHCNHTGYFNRVAIHEVMMIDDDLRSLIVKDASIIDIKAEALRKGFLPMRYDGIKKALRGLTSLEEVDRATLLEFGDETSSPPARPVSIDCIGAERLN